MEAKLIFSIAAIFGITYVSVVVWKAIKRDRDRREYEAAIKAGESTEITRDKYGNEFHVCKICRAPVVLDGIELKCLNGCSLGTAYVAPRDERPSEQNNYNPTLFTQCLKCRGSGKEYFKDAEDWCAKVCDQCQGKGGFLGKKYSPAEEEALSQPQAATVDDEGRTDCPKCGFRFYVTDKNVWSDGRHARCGQKIAVPDAWRRSFNSTSVSDS